MSVTQLRGTTQVKNATISTVKLQDFLITPSKISNVITDDFTFPNNVTATNTLLAGAGGIALQIVSPNTGLGQPSIYNSGAGIGWGTGGNGYNVGDCFVVNGGNGGVNFVAGNNYSLINMEARFDTKILNADGVVATPSYAFTSVPGTGMFYDPSVDPASPGLGFSTNGVLRAMIAQSGDYLELKGNMMLMLRKNGAFSDPAIRIGDANDVGLFAAASGTLGFEGNGIEHARIGDNSGQPGLTLLNNSSLYNNDGTAAAPSYTFVSDNDTGMYSAGANILGVSVAGTETARFDTNGIKLIDGTSTNPSISFTSQPGFGFYMQGSDGVGTTCDFAIPTDNVLALGDISSVDWALSHDSGSSSMLFFHNGTPIVKFPDAATGIQLINGSNSNPSYSFITAPTTGMFLNDPTEIGFTAGATQIMVLGTSEGGMVMESGYSIHMGDDSKFSAADGTAAAPSYTFESAADLGLYYKAADAQPAGMVFSSGGTLRAIFGDNALSFYDGFSLAFATDFDGAITFGPTGLSQIAGNDTRIEIEANGSLIIKIEDTGVDVNTHKIHNVVNPTAPQDAATKSYVDSQIGSSFVTRETPSGTVDGSNAVFTLAFTPVLGTEEVFLNGLLQDQGAGEDYTISGATITFASAPATGSKIRVNYEK